MSSEKLGSAKSLLKGNLGGSYSILEGCAGNYTDLGIARSFGGASGAYSLRDIGAVNGRVVKVRRDVDGQGSDPEEDFSANQVDSGALENWVNGKLEDTLPADVATAAAAYSLRKVKDSYTGNAARIRRGSDDVEVNVAFNSQGRGGKVSTSSSISAVSGSTTATDLNGFLNETLSDRFSAVDYPSGIGSDFRKWSTLTATSNSFEATTGTFADNTARYNYVLPETLTAAESASTTFRFSGTVDYTASGGTGFVIKQGSNAIASSTHDFANLTSTGVGTISSDTFKFSNGDSGDFSFEFTGNGSNDFRSIVFLQTIVSSGSSSISLTNLKFEIIKHGATVHTWYDQAGSNNAVQATAANQPQIADNGALLTDGIEFDGSASFLDATSALGATSTIGIFSVIKPDSTDNDGFILDNRDAADDGTRLMQSDAGIGKYLFSMDTTDVSLADEGVSTTETLITAIQSSTAATLFRNAVQVATAANNPISVTSAYRIGANRVTDGITFFDGTMKEIILFTSDQTDNRFKIESNINNYYGLYNDANEVTGAFTASGENSFTANGTDGFTIESATADAFAGIELNEKVPNNDVIYISFNADLSVSGTASPTVALRKTSISGTVSSDSPNSGQPAVTQGFNYFGLVCSDADAKFITFLEDANSVSYTISDFRVSRIARNGFVETWYDQSDSGNNATQTTAADQPLIVHNGGQVKNSKGKPALDFVAVADHFDVPILIDNINTASTFIVFERDVNSGNGAVAGQLGSSSSTSRFYTPLFTGSSMYWGYGNSSTKINMGTYDANRTYLASFVTGDTNAEAFLDNVSKGTTAVQSAAIDATNGAIGRHTRGSSSFPLDGQVSEVIYYKAKLQDDVADLNTDINNYYNIY